MFTAKRSQMEMMGLMVIIILVALGMLFVIQFIVVKEGSQLKKTYTYSQLATNTVNSVLKTTTSCKGQDINQLLQDCASGGTIDCNGKNSCTSSTKIQTIGTFFFFTSLLPK